MRDISEYGNKRILIVDPDIGTINLLRLMLSEYDCVCANNGETAVKLYSKFKPDLVLTEIPLPETNGVELQRKFLK
ncbi:MAG: response regulator [Archaeoglobus sp.]|nr:response regulator [Archaeoglobus sp.]